MPWAVFENESEDGDRYCVYKVDDDGNATGEALACHATEDAAEAQVAALYANEPGAGKALAADGLVSFGETVKAMGVEDGKMKVAAYGIRFGSEEERDVQGEWFAPDTDYGPLKGNGVVTMFHHGIPIKAALAGLADRTFAPVKTVADDIGIFVETVLDLADDYEAAIAKLVQAGKLRWSSGSAPQVARTDRETGKITRWHPIEFSYTPTAAEPRLPTIAPVKALSDVTYPGLEAEPQATATEAVAAPATAGVTVNVYVDGKALSQSAEQTAQETPKSTEDTHMSDETKTAPAPAPALDIESIVNAAVGKAVSAVNETWETRLKAAEEERAKNEPPVNAGKAGFAVTDQADRALEGRPFKTAGEFYQAVASGSRPGGYIDERLLPLRSTDPQLENGFNVAKALGDSYVGSLYHGSLRVKGASGISGLGERVPSDGGFLVGTDTGGLMERVYSVGDLLQRVDMMPISANSNGMTLYAEDETSRADGSRRGGVRGYWVAEAGSITSSKPKFREMNLKLRKVAAVVYATDELLADASALEAYILRNVPEELRFMCEDAIINGTGAGQPAGILGSGAVISVSAESGQGSGTIVMENIVKMYARLWAPSRRNAVWLIDQSCEPQLYTMALSVGTGGLPVYMPPGGLSAAPYGQLMGRPVVAHEYGAAVGTAGDIMLCDLSQYQMIEKGGIEAASSMHVLFLYDEQAFRFVYRVDGQSKWNSALTPNSGGDTQSPFVSLASR